MGEAGALMIVREDKHLGFAGQTPKRRSMQNAVSVALETAAVGVWIFRDCSVATTHCMGG
jgi:hypothetical protein